MTLDILLIVPWEIKFFKTNRGKEPVKEFIASLETSTRVKVSHHINLLELHGSYLNMPYSRKLLGDIYELRIRGVQEIRITYCFRGRSVYLLHVFKKQTQTTPAKEIRISQSRLSELDE